MDLIESKFKIIAKEPLSKYSLTNVHYSLLSAGLTHLNSLSSTGLSWNAKRVDCTHSMFYFKDNYLGFNYKNKINWYQLTSGANIIDAAFTINGNGVILTDDNVVRFTLPIESGTADASVDISSVLTDPSLIERVDTVTDCLDQNNEFFYISYSDSIERLKIDNNGNVIKKTISFNETLLHSASTDLGEIVALSKNETEVCITIISPYGDISKSNCFTSPSIIGSVYYITATTGIAVIANRF